MPMNQESSPKGPKSGWEVADGIASGVGKAARGTGRVLVKIYSVVLIAVGVLALFAGGGAIVGGLILIAYGLYLMFGGSWVIW